MIKIIKEIASQVYDENQLFLNSKDIKINWVYLSMFDDEVLQNAELFSTIKKDDIQNSEELKRKILSDDVFSKVFSENNKIGPMLFTPLGGSRIGYNQTICGFFSSAFYRIYYFRLQNTKAIYIEKVLEGFNSFKEMIIKKRTKIYYLSGLGKIKNSADSTIHTSFGMIINKAICKVKKPYYIKQRTFTNCLLISEKEIPVEIKFGNNPVSSIHKETMILSDEKIQIAFALASKNYLNPCMPSINWRTYFFNFMNGNSISLPSDNYYHNEIDICDLSKQLESFSEKINSHNLQKIDIALTRICSAIGKRENPRDSLIDAVMSWENMFGTHNEVTYRVSTAISILLNNNLEERLADKKKLSKIYGHRSRIVHGDDLKLEDVKESSQQAIKIALEALSKLFNKGDEYLLLKSEQRSDKIICE